MNVFVSIISGFFSFLTYRYYLSWKRKKKEYNKRHNGTDRFTAHDNYIAVKIIGVIFGLTLISIVYLSKSFN